MKPQQELQLFADSVSLLLQKLQSTRDFLGAGPQQVGNLLISGGFYTDASYINEFAKELYYLCCKFACIDEYNLALEQLVNNNDSSPMLSFLKQRPQIALFLKTHIDALSDIYLNCFKVPKQIEIEIKKLRQQTPRKNQNEINGFAKKQKTWKSPPVQTTEEAIEEEFNLVACISNCLKTITTIMDRENNTDSQVQYVVHQLSVFLKENSSSSGSIENKFVLAMINVASGIATLKESFNNNPNETVKKIYQELLCLHNTLISEQEKLMTTPESFMNLYQ